MAEWTIFDEFVPKPDELSKKVGGTLGVICGAVLIGIALWFFIGFLYDSSWEYNDAVEITLTDERIHQCTNLFYESGTLHCPLSDGSPEEHFSPAAVAHIKDAQGYTYRHRFPLPRARVI